MLVLSRKLHETIVIEGGIRITVTGIQGNQVRLGIKAPDHVGIYREELDHAKREAKRAEDLGEQPMSPGLQTSLKF